MSTAKATSSVSSNPIFSYDPVVRGDSTRLVVTTSRIGPRSYSRPLFAYSLSPVFISCAAYLGPRGDGHSPVNFLFISNKAPMLTPLCMYTHTQRVIRSVRCPSVGATITSSAAAVPRDLLMIPLRDASIVVVVVEDQFGYYSESTHRLLRRQSLVVDRVELADLLLTSLLSNSRGREGDMGSRGVFSACKLGALNITIGVMMRVDRQMSDDHCSSSVE